MDGRLIKAISGFYYVICDGVIYECKARGALRKAGFTPLVGDHVRISLIDSTHGVLEEVLPRQTVLQRPALANVDQLCIVSSYTTPAPDGLLIDRMTAIAEFYGIEPLIVFNKCDLGDFSHWANVYRRAGFQTFVVSAQTLDGVNELRRALFRHTTAFTGNSGVGKSSLLNALFADLSLATGEVSEKLGRGRHTTRHTQLFACADQSYVVDTPGFSSLDTVHLGVAFKERLPYCFREFRPYLDQCRYTGCSHTTEQGCAIRVKVREGVIDSGRHAGYCVLVNECRTIHEWDEKKRAKNQHG